MTDPQSPIIKPYEKFLLFVGIVTILLFMLQNKTGKVVETVDTEVFTKGLTTLATPRLQALCLIRCRQ